MGKNEWIVDWQDRFPDARSDVLEFIYDFNNCSVNLHDIFASGYCLYFTNMLEIAFNRGRVCWSVGQGHIVWMDDNNVAYDIGGVYYDYEQLLPVEYLGELVGDFKHTDWEYRPTDSKIAAWCTVNNITPIKAVTKLWACIPSELLDYTGTVEQDVIANWDKYIDQLIVIDSSIYTVSYLIRRLPYSVRNQYSSDRECVLANVNLLLNGRYDS